MKDEMLSCECGDMPKLYSAAGEFRIKCNCGATGDWARHSLGALMAWNAALRSKQGGEG